MSTYDQTLVAVKKTCDSHDEDRYGTGKIMASCDGIDVKVENGKIVAGPGMNEILDRLVSDLPGVDVTRETLRDWLYVALVFPDGLKDASFSVHVIFAKSVTGRKHLDRITPRMTVPAAKKAVSGARTSKHDRPDKEEKKKEKQEKQPAELISDVLRNAISFPQQIAPAIVNTLAKMPEDDQKLEIPLLIRSTGTQLNNLANRYDGVELDDDVKAEAKKACQFVREMLGKIEKMLVARPQELGRDTETKTAKKTAVAVTK
jgi:hypothetical protein